jgi:hypothetical protein
VHIYSIHSNCVSSGQTRELKRLQNMKSCLNEAWWSSENIMMIHVLY